ncbi:MAG: hypothetical protein ACMXYD_04525 [Candidatus Woesearchaeota archaeon]
MDVVNSSSDFSFLVQQELSFRAREEFGSVLDDVLENIEKNTISLTAAETSIATKQFDSYLRSLSSSLQYSSHAQRFVDVRSEYFSLVEFGRVAIPEYRYDKGYSTPEETVRTANSAWVSARNQLGSFLQHKEPLVATREVFGGFDELFAFFALQVDARVLSEEVVRRSYVLSRHRREAKTGLSRLQLVFGRKEFTRLKQAYQTLPKEGFSSEQELYTVLSSAKKFF